MKGNGYPTAAGMKILERIFESGPTPLAPINPRTYAHLDENGYVVTTTLGGVVCVDLSGEGKYFMSGELP
ncbi:hypothetical protein [Brevundimonas sp.]|uniref:hypothetical protein n=1 Tax=Brevundimonas sp. TaxID=1871086 RepID=UPI00286CDEC5|nr:hypothetical protein [Brevundimonas sp.]